MYGTEARVGGGKIDPFQIYNLPHIAFHIKSNVQYINLCPMRWETHAPCRKPDADTEPNPFHISVDPLGSY